MEDIKRYEIEIEHNEFGRHFLEPVNDLQGDWVKYSDHIKEKV